MLLHPGCDAAPRRPGFFFSYSPLLYQVSVPHALHWTLARAQILSYTGMRSRSRYSVYSVRLSRVCLECEYGNLCTKVVQYSRVRSDTVIVRLLHCRPHPTARWLSLAIYA